MAINTRKEWLEAAIKGLRVARGSIKLGPNGHRICNALYFARCDHKISWDDLDVCTSLIDRALEEHVFFEAWIVARNPTLDEADGALMKELRLQWLDQMIHDYKEMLSEYQRP